MAYKLLRLIGAVPFDKLLLNVDLEGSFQTTVRTSSPSHRTPILSVAYGGQPCQTLYLCTKTAPEQRNESLADRRSVARVPHA